MDFEKVFGRMIFDNYYTSKELMYDSTVGILMNPYQYGEFLNYKKTLLENNNEHMRALELKTFNDMPIYFCLPSCLLETENAYLRLISEDLVANKQPLMLRNLDEMNLSRVYSEIEGSLNIEAVPTTRKVVDEIASGKRVPQNNNEKIIKNMINGIEFVNKGPEFNETNLYTLYNILSEDCLEEEDKLLEGNIYRHDGVEVGGYKGCPVEKIKECMDSLFDFVNKNISNKDMFTELPHIAHYYLVYVHPYFDYNGRTARMISYWISLLTNKGVLPPVVSEAIYQTKSQYYSALSETRDGGNDITYFLKYIFDVSIKYFLTYKNVEHITQTLKNQSIVLSNNEKIYVKKILICNKGKFTYNDFADWVDLNITKQGALKILNNLESYGFLKSEITKSNKKLFEVNMSLVQYIYNNK